TGTLGSDVPANTVDNTLGTWWTADGQSNGTATLITWDLGSNQNLKYAKIAVPNGNTIKNNFTLYVWGEGGHSSTILTLSTTGTTAKEEFLNLCGVARYVEYVGGVNTFNSGG